MVHSLIFLCLFFVSSLPLFSTGSLDELLQYKRIDSLLDSPVAFKGFILSTCSQCTLDSSAKGSTQTFTLIDKATQSTIVFTISDNVVKTVKRELKIRQSQGDLFFETIKDILDENGWSTTIATLERTKQEFTKVIDSKKIDIDLKFTEGKSGKKSSTKPSVITWEISWEPTKQNITSNRSNNDTPIAPSKSKYFIDISQLKPCNLPNKLRWNISFNELEVLLKTNKIPVDTIYKGSGSLVGYGNIVSSLLEEKQEVQYTFLFQELTLHSITKIIEYDNVSLSLKAFEKLKLKMLDNGWSVLDISLSEQRVMFVNQCLPMNNVFSALTMGLSPVDSSSLYITMEQMGNSDIASFPKIKQRVIDIEKEQSLQACATPHEGLPWGSDSATVQTWLIDNGFRIFLPINSRKNITIFRYGNDENPTIDYSVFVRGNDFYRWQKERKFDSPTDAQILFKILVDDARLKFKNIDISESSRYIFKQQCVGRTYTYTLYKKNDSTIVQEIKSASPSIQTQELLDYQRLLFATKYYGELPMACTMPFDINRNASPAEVEKIILYYGFTKAPVTGDAVDNKGIKTVPFYYGTTSNEQLIVSFSNSIITQFEVRATFTNVEDYEKYTRSVSNQLDFNFQKKDIVAKSPEIIFVKPTCDTLPSELEIASEPKKKQFRWVLKLL